MSLNGSDLSAGANKTSFGDTGIIVNDDDTIDVEIAGTTSEITGVLSHPKTEASYIVFTDGTTIYAKNGVTGQIDYSGVVASTVIQAAIDALTTTGGKIFIKSGTYTITTALSVISSLTVEGVFTAGSATQLTCSGINMFEYVGGGTVSFVCLKNMYLDGGGGSGSGVDFNANVQDTRLENLYVANFPEDGIYIGGAWGFVGNNLVCERNGGYGIYLASESSGKVIGGKFNNNEYGAGCLATGSQFIGNEFGENNQDGIEVAADRIIVANNRFYANSQNPTGTHYEIELTTNADNSIIDGNTIECTTKSKSGVYLPTGAEYVTVNNNRITGATEAGILFGTTRLCNINNNIISGCGTHGIHLGAGYENNIIGNIIVLSTNDGIFLDTGDRNQIENNYLNDNGRYGVNISANTATYNLVKNNNYDGNTTAPINDSAANSKLNTITYQFTEAINGAITTTSPTGINVDATTEAALAWGQLPNNVHLITRMRIWGVALGSPAAAGGQMHLEVTFNAGVSDAAYNTASKSWNITNKDSTTVDYVSNDIIYWQMKDTDVGNELSNLVPGDSFEIFAIYESEVSPDGATNAVIRCVELEYV